MLLHIWLYSLLKVCVRRRRHCKELKEKHKINQKYLIFDFKWSTVICLFFFKRVSYFSGQLLLTVYQALDVCGVVSAALTGRDGALKGGGGDLRGDAGGGAEGAAAQTGRQKVAQGFRRSRLTQFLKEQQQVACLLHLTRTEMGISVWRSPLPVRYSYADEHRQQEVWQCSIVIFCLQCSPHATARVSPAPTGAPGSDCLLWVSSLPGSPLHAHTPQKYPEPFVSVAAYLKMNNEMIQYSRYINISIC